jgi:class 3 adenylate cyclase
MRNPFAFTLQSKLLLTLLIVSLLSILTVGAVSFVVSRKILSDRMRQQLSGQRQARAEQIKLYLEHVRNDALTMATIQKVIEGMKEFDQIVKELPKTPLSEGEAAQLNRYYETQLLPLLRMNFDSTPTVDGLVPTDPIARYLQYHYNANEIATFDKKFVINRSSTDKSLYADVHEKYHIIFKAMVLRSGFEDMMLVAKDGREVYTMSKQADFGQNLFDGGLINDHCAQMVEELQRVAIPGIVRFADFAPYVMGGGYSTGFVGSPIFDGAQHIGYLVLQLPQKNIDRIMTSDGQWEKSGFGESGETYLIGGDRRMRSNSRFIVQNADSFLGSMRRMGLSEKNIDIMRQTQSTVGQFEVNTDAARQVIRGNTDTIEATDYRGEAVLSSYQNINFPDLNWSVIAESDLKQAEGPIRDMEKRLLIAACSVVLALALLSLLLAKWLTGPLNRLVDGAQRITGGELNTTIPIKSSDEFGTLAHSINEITQQLREQEHQLEEGKKENSHLLHTLLPQPIAQRYRAGESFIADLLPQVTVVRVHIGGADDLMKKVSITSAVEVLDDLMSRLEDLSQRFGVEKVVTPGLSYLAVCGLSAPRIDHLPRAIDFSQMLLETIHEINLQHQCQMRLHIGIATGTLYAGLIGREKIQYDVWGDPLTQASRLAVHAPVNGILTTQEVKDASSQGREFNAQSALQQPGQESLAAWQLIK